MNAIFFAAKRAFQATLRVTRPWLKCLGLTAARFDMLAAIREYPQGVRQQELRSALGVTAPTISRMLRSLEELGLVQRERCLVDRRQLHVTLTPAGRIRIRRAFAAFIRTGAAQLAVDCALVGPEACADESRCIIQMSRAESILGRIRHAFRDVAHLYYPWHPDD